jgi:hypothetical protein
VSQTDIALIVLGFVSLLILAQMSQKLSAIHTQLTRVNEQIWESRPVQDRVYGKQQ